MSNIVTLTLSPCIDKSTSVAKFIPEKKLKCAAAKYEPGGGGINVSRSLSKFGSDSTAIYVSGGHTGKFLDELIAHENISSFPVVSMLNTRENFIVFENATHLQFRFGMPTNPVKKSEWKHIIKFLASLGEIDYLVISGSINPGIDDEFFTELNRIIKQKKCRVIADTAGKPLLKIIAGGAFLIKPNQNEYAQLYGQTELTIEKMKETSMDLIQQGLVENCIVSLGERGALLVTKDKAVLYTPPQIEVKSTVGAGDSMIAGIIFSLVNNKTIYDSVKYGVSCGTATTLNPGTDLFKISDVEKIYGTVTEKTI